MIPQATDAWLLLGLRLLMAGSLMGFVVAVLVVAQRDLAAVARAAGHPAGREGATLRLMVLDGGQAGLTAGTGWPLTPGATIGRAAGNDIVIDDPFLSGRHAEVVREAGGWWLRDRGSTNGTLLNGTPVAALTAIRPGDVLQFGSIRLQAIAGEPSIGDAR